MTRTKNTIPPIAAPMITPLLLELEDSSGSFSALRAISWEFPSEGARPRHATSAEPVGGRKRQLHLHVRVDE